MTIESVCSGVVTWPDIWAFVTQSPGTDIWHEPLLSFTVIQSFGFDVPVVDDFPAGVPASKLAANASAIPARRQRAFPFVNREYIFIPFTFLTPTVFVGYWQIIFP
jgi:hypothetical protein